MFIGKRQDTLVPHQYKVDGVLAVFSFSTTLYSPFYFLLADAGLTTSPLSEVVFQALFQGIFAVLIVLFFYSKAVEILGVACGALFGALVPAVALFLVIPILNLKPSAL